MLPLMRGETDSWREYLHGERRAMLPVRKGLPFPYRRPLQIPLGKPGRPGTAALDLNANLDEHFNLVHQPINCALPDVWRPRMIGTLRERPEGFTDRERLIAGQRHDVLVET